MCATVCRLTAPMGSIVDDLNEPARYDSVAAVFARIDIITIGASAGGVEALQVVASGLPADLRAAVFVVLHIGSGVNGSSVLPRILSRAGPLPAKHPID